MMSCAGLRRALLAGSALTLIAMPAVAQTAQTWNGNTSTDWFTGTNWDSTTVPAAGDSATLDTVTPNPTVLSGAAGGYSAVNLNGLNVGFTATGQLTISNGASVTISNNDLVIGGDLSGVATSASGTVVLDASTLTATGTPPTGGTIFVGASGTGSFTVQNGGGVTTVDSYVGHLQGTNGTVTVNAGTWANSRDNFVGNYGTGVFDVLNGGRVTVTRDTVLGANTSGNGTIDISGATSIWTTTRYTILGGNATTQVGGTGTLDVSNGGTYNANGEMFVGLVGSGVVNITSGGKINTSSGITYFGYGAGSTATVIIDGAGSTWTDTGTGLMIGGNDGSTASGNATVTIRNGGALSASNIQLGSDSTHTSQGTLTVTGLGSTVNASNVYVGWDAKGTVNVLDHATFSLTGDLTVGSCSCSFGTMTVSGGSTVTIGGAWTIGESSGSTGTMTVSGSGTSVTATGDLQVGSIGAGTLSVQDGASVTAANAYVGFSTGSNGTLTITGGSTFSTAIVNIGGVAGSKGAATVSGAGSRLTATGDLTVGDNGTGALTVQSGASVTAVNGAIGNNAGSSGTVNVTGAGSTLTLSGALLIGAGGIGTGALRIGDGGVVNVTGNTLNGDSITVGAGSTLNTANYSATSGVTTAIGLRSSSAGQINAGTGTATLAGTLAISGHNSVATTYTLVHSSSLGGSTFVAVTYATALRNAVITYTAGDVLLTVDAYQLAASLPSSATDNQRAVAQALDNVVAGGTSLSAGLDYVFNLTGDVLLSALTQLAGENATTPIQAGFTASNQFMNLMSGQGTGAPSGGGSGATAYAAEEKIDPRAAEAYAAVTPRDRRAADFAARWGVWASGYGGSMTVKGDAGTGSSDTTSRVYGMAAGADYRFTPDTTAGFALGGAGSTFGAGGGSGRADIFQAGLYARHRFGASYVSAALAYGWQRVSTDRTVTVSGTDKLEAGFNAQTFAARLEGGHRFAMRGLGLTLYAALQSTSFFLPSYAESVVSGSSQYALSYASQTTTNVRSELGLRVDKAFVLASNVLTLKGRAAWAHDSNTARAVTATFQALPGATFAVNGARPSADSALLSAGADIGLGHGWSAAAMFDGEFSRTTASYAGKGSLRYAW